MVPVRGEDLRLYGQGPGCGILEAMIDTATGVATRSAGRRRTLGHDSAAASSRPRIPIETLAQAVERARYELRGSVAEEALPEMAVRLAKHRMRRTSS